MSGARETEPGGQGQRGQFAVALAAQQPQGVVLLRRQVVAAEQLLFEHVQPVVRAPRG